MKRIIALCLLACSMAITVPLFTQGCATQTKEAQTFQTFKTTWTTAHAAYAQWCERVVQGKVTAAQEEQADNAWSLFRATFKAALLAASGNMAAAPPVNLQASANRVLELTK